MVIRNFAKTAFLKLVPLILRPLYWMRQVKPVSESDGLVPILVYHKITNLREGLDAQWNVPPALFADQMAYLRSEKFSVLSLADFFTILRLQRKPPPKPIVITFDDGYAGVSRHAYPVLKAFGFPATVFVAVDYVEKQRLFWWDRRVLERLPEHHENLRMLNWSEILEMQSSDIVSFGSHTMTHPHLGTLPPEKIEYELAASKAILETRLGRPAHFFAYPGGIRRYGDLSRETEQILIRCGYHLACTSVFGRNGFGQSAYELKRIGIGRADTLPVFRAKVAGACDWMETAQSAFQQVFKNVY
jgi:peptidoglycan/xylan/chitin deacetylase (PgdA/CDA1 family)